MPAEQWIKDAQRAVGDRVRVRRLYKNMTQELLAERSGVTRSTIQRIEAGSNDAKLSHLLRIARELDIMPSELLR